MSVSEGLTISYVHHQCEMVAWLNTEIMKKNVWKLYEKNHDMLTLKAAFRNYPWVRPIPYNPDLLTM